MVPGGPAAHGAVHRNYNVIFGTDLVNMALRVA